MTAPRTLASLKPDRAVWLRAALCAAVALMAWVGVFFFLLHIHAADDSTLKLIRTLQSARSSEESQSQMQSLIASTRDNRAHLQDLLSIDVITLANLVEGAGHDAGVDLQVSNATPEGQVQLSKGSPLTMSAVGFLVNAEGSFSHVLQALALLEALPIPSTIEDVTLVRSEDTKSTWELHAHIRILTTLPVSS